VRVLFAGGGTGGHIYPAIALADALRNRAALRFIGTADRLERSIVPQAGYELVTVASRPLSRENPLLALQSAGANALGIAQSAQALLEFKPDVIIATGGYVCFPVVVAARALRAARLLNVKVALLEPNAQPGLTNRMLAPLVDEVWGAFPSAREYFGAKYHHTGVPVRESLLHPRNRIEAARRLNLDPGRRTIVAIGGSQGARSINETIAALVTRRALPETWQVLHVSGERDFEYMKAEEREPFGENRVSLQPYIADMADAYDLAAIVIARAGASTLGELAALGIASILVPYPFAADAHQLRNARAFESAGACVVIEDRDLNPDTLWWTLRAAMEPERLEELRGGARSLGARDAVTTIIARVDALAPRRTAA
jgi:UDP-N-acetylglucosamine--N-acetylmuramyl-(pentapeptide) pyrophosphoryl-undecaprenol N-acetylglucosamine transferase